MLKFYGIRFNQKGTPERFSLSFSLNESLHLGLQLLEKHQKDKDETAKAIDREIESLFQGGDSAKNSKRFRFSIAKWFRAKDIVSFLLSGHEWVELKLAIARVLDKGDKIKKKWQEIESLMLDHLTGLESKTRNELLSNPESEVNLILQMVSLLFLEQDDEVPPANLELQFIRYQFPRIIWKKRDGFNAASNPFWLPKNMYCRSSYLMARIISRIYEGARDGKAGGESMALDSTVETGVPQAVSYSSLFPAEHPDEIRLELEELDEENQQMSMIPESAAETLLSLQKMIQRRFSHLGVKHLLGILRQLSGCDGSGCCRFDVGKHLHLVAKPSKDGQFSKKQRLLFTQVFSILSRIRVKRFWRSSGQQKETNNPFILEFYTECDPDNEECQVKRLLLDPLFLPGRHNPYHLGIHLRLVPPAIFQENSQKHALLPGLASYLTGTWLNEFRTHTGTASKTTRDIVEGCAFNVTPAAKLRIIDKVKSELAYMKEKCYISDYSYHKNEEGNPWDDLHHITASERVLAAIAEKMQVQEANSSSEKLIA